MSFVVCPLGLKIDGYTHCCLRGKACVQLPLERCRSSRKSTEAVLIAIKSKAMGQQVNFFLFFFLTITKSFWNVLNLVSEVVLLWNKCCTDSVLRKPVPS